MLVRYRESCNNWEIIQNEIRSFVNQTPCSQTTETELSSQMDINPDIFTLGHNSELM